MKGFRGTFIKDEQMSNPNSKRTNTEKVKIFRSFFNGLNNVYGTYDPVTGRAWQEKKPVTYDVLDDFSAAFSRGGRSRARARKSALSSP